MTNYSIDTDDGNQITAGLQGYDQARKVAQRFADERGEAVYLYAPSEVRAAEEAGEEHESEEIEPSVILTISDAAAAVGLDARNYAALESGDQHTLTEDDILSAGGEWLPGRKAVAVALACGGWDFDAELCSTWHAPIVESPEAGGGLTGVSSR